MYNAIILEKYQSDNLRKLCYTQISIAKYNYSFDMIIYTIVRIRSSQENTNTTIYL